MSKFGFVLFENESDAKNALDAGYLQHGSIIIHIQEYSLKNKKKELKMSSEGHYNKISQKATKQSLEEELLAEHYLIE